MGPVSMLFVAAVLALRFCRVGRKEDFICLCPRALLVTSKRSQHSSLGALTSLSRFGEGSSLDGVHIDSCCKEN